MIQIAVCLSWFAISPSFFSAICSVFWLLKLNLCSSLRYVFHPSQIFSNSGKGYAISSVFFFGTLFVFLVGLCDLSAGSF